MAKVTLGSFINKLESKFEKSHEAWEKAQKAYWEKFTKYSQIDRFKYSPDGLREIDEQFKKDKEKFEEDIATIQKDFKEYAEQIEKDAGKIFDRLYEFTPADMDAAGVEIVKSSGLSNAELMKLGDKYKEAGNNTMYFYCASHIDVDKKNGLEMLNNEESFALKYKEKAELERRNREDKDILEGFALLCDAALRDNKTLADGIYKEHESDYVKYYKLAQKIATADSSIFE